MIAFNRNGVDVCCAAAERVLLRGSGSRSSARTSAATRATSYTVQLQGPQRTALAIDLLPVIDALREIHNEHAGRADERYWMRSIGTWVEPFSGRLDYVIDGLAVRVDDRGLRRARLRGVILQPVAAAASPRGMLPSPATSPRASLR